MNDFPTGFARNTEELDNLLAITKHPSFQYMIDLLERSRKIAEKAGRKPSNKNSTYDWGYNNGCLDQLDMLLSLPENLETQQKEVERYEQN